MTLSGHVYLHDFGDPVDRELGVVRPRPVVVTVVITVLTVTIVVIADDHPSAVGVTTRAVRRQPVRRQRRDGRRAARVRGLAIRVSASHDHRPMSRDDGTLVACATRIST